jgi:hypothetical protein
MTDRDLTMGETYTCNADTIGFCRTSHHSGRAIWLWVAHGGWEGGATLGEQDARLLRDHLTAWLDAAQRDAGRPLGSGG